VITSPFLDNLVAITNRSEYVAQFILTDVVASPSLDMYISKGRS